MTLVGLMLIIMSFLASAAGFIGAGLALLFFFVLCVVALIISPFVDSSVGVGISGYAALVAFAVLFIVLVVIVVHGIAVLRRSLKAYAAAKKFAAREESVAQRAAALWNASEPGTRRVLTIAGVDFAFRYCPSGNFTTGDSNDEGFWISETPTTQAQWNALGGRKAKRCKFKGANLPVENVCWKECGAYVKRLKRIGAAPEGLRFDLPTEEQWERACRAGSNDSDVESRLDEFAWHKANSEKKTHEVGVKKPNAWGVCDMQGNVWEQTKSKYGRLGASLVKRGGSWRDAAQDCRSTSRRKFGRWSYRPDLGFRLVLVRRESK